MATKQKGLGRGLDVLLGSAIGSEKTVGDNCLLNIDKLRANPNQPRKQFKQVALQELADSMKAQGILQPLLVRPVEDGLYEIVAGERRWRAASLAGIEEIPVIIREMSDKDVMAAALIENLQREDLNPIEEALALKNLRDALEITQEDLAKRLGKSRSAIANAMRLLQLSQAAQDDLRDGIISAGHARCLLALQGDGSEEAAEMLRSAIIQNNINVRDTEDAVEYWKNNGSLPEHLLIQDSPEITAESMGWASDNSLPSQVTKEEISKKSSRRKSEFIKSIQKLLSEQVCKTSVSGDLDSGKITLCYNSIDELHGILLKFGINTAETDKIAVGG